MTFFFHEQLYRTPDVLEKIRGLSVCVCGAGALGANLVESLARTGFSRLAVIDRDRIEARNLSTQPYYHSDIGAMKAKILSHSLYRALGVKVEAHATELTTTNVTRLLGTYDLVVDAFDNSASRRAIADACSARPCLHAGLADGYAEILWNEVYRVPSPTNDDVCDYPLARTLAGLAVSVACEVVVRFAASGVRESYTVTLGDLAIRRFV